MLFFGIVFYERRMRGRLLFDKQVCGTVLADVMCYVEMMLFFHLSVHIYYFCTGLYIFKKESEWVGSPVRLLIQSSPDGSLLEWIAKLRHWIPDCTGLEKL